MLASREECLKILRCPKTKLQLKVQNDRSLTTVSDSGSLDEANEYPIVNGVPVIINFQNSVLKEEETKLRLASSVIERKEYRGYERVIKRLLSPEKVRTRENVSKLVDLLSQLPENANVLVVAGGSVGQGMNSIYEHKSINVYGFDLYISPHVQFVADAHDIPVSDEQFDAVIIQAVLEHTLQPQQVVDEIWRVLKKGGIVYAETPFMQQVHEGAYDFTRFSDSGHRYLFRHFDVIKSGASGGPGLQFMWSVDYLARSVFRSRLAGKLVKLAFFWTQYLDRIIPEKYAIDGASGVYFMGRKQDDSISAPEIITYYQGAQ